MAHQKEGVYDYGNGVDNPAFLMEMRLGKTLTLIRWAKHKRIRKPCYVSAPLGVLEGWENELRAERERLINLHGLSWERKLAAVRYSLETGKRFWLLNNHEALMDPGTRRQRVEGRRNTPKATLAKVPWGLVVVDESTALANPRNLFYKVAVPGFRNADHRSILTGLIAPESLLQLFGQLAFLDGEVLGFRNFWDFRDKLFFQVGYEWIPKTGTEKRLKELLHTRCFVRTREDAGMPDRFVPEIRMVEMNAKQRKVYKQVWEEYAHTVTKVFKNRIRRTRQETNWILTREQWLARIAGGFSPGGELLSDAKLFEILNLAKTELAGQQFVTWFRFRDTEQKHAAEFFEKHKIPALVINGETPVDLRKQRRLKFRRYPKYRSLLSTQKCSRFGSDFSNADAAIYYSNEYSNELRQQSKDRIVHPKKDVPLLLVDIVTRDTVDEVAVEALGEKALRSQSVMTNRIIERFL